MLPEVAVNKELFRHPKNPKYYTGKMVQAMIEIGMIHQMLYKKVGYMMVFKVKVADTIGAGDAFTAGLLYKIARIGETQVFSNIKPTLTFASAISAIICTKKGANQALKDIKQVSKVIKKAEGVIKEKLSK